MKTLLLKIFIGLLLYSFNFLYLKAQNNTSSPYSMFGLGDIESRGSIRSSGMGGVGISFDSKDAINILNPASYSGIDSTAFVFEIGGMGKFTTLKTFRNQEKVNDGNISAINFGFRTNKWWAMSFGLLPYSNIGYKIDTEKIISGTTTPYLNTIEGQGGINQVYIGNSFKFRNLSFGINAAFLFGNLTILETNAALNNEFYAMETENSYFLRNFYFDYGLQYRFRLKKMNYTLGLTFSNQQKLLSTFNTETTIETGEILNEESSSAKDIVIPQGMGVGLAVEIPDRLTLAVDYTLQDWSENTFYTSTADFKSSQSIRFGLEYKPVRSFRKNYLNFVDYRVGAFYSDLYYQIYGIPIIEKGVSIGLGLPFRTTKIDLSLEYGIKGTTQNNLVEENFFKLKVGLLLKQKWFQKRKFY